MVHFEGQEEFNTPRAEVYAKLTDAGFLAQCLPDAQIHEATVDRAAWKLKPKLSFLTGALDTTLIVTAKTPETVAEYMVLGKAIGASSTVTATLTFQDRDTGGTIVNWVGDITALTGLLKMVPKGLLQSAAQSVIAEVWAGVRAKVV